ncbi:MAG: hypothetical protein KF893_05605 [Caldilineaceae bacterium]|nr:hypothetical protein [Caldilineaceae bacterium]
MTMLTLQNVTKHFGCRREAQSGRPHRCHPPEGSRCHGRRRQWVHASW